MSTEGTNGPGTTNTPDVNATSGNSTVLGNSPSQQARDAALKSLTTARTAEETKKKEADATKKEADLSFSVDDIPEDSNEVVSVDRNAVLSRLDLDARKLMSNLRADYTKKTTSLAQEKKALEAAKAQLEADRKAMMESGMYERMTEIADKNVEVDPFNPKTIEDKINQEVAKRLKEMLEPIKKESESAKRQMALDTFKRDNPDFVDYKIDIAKALQDDSSLTLEKAYYMVKGKASTSSKKELEAELASYKKAAADYGLKVGGANRASASGIPEAVRKQGSVAIYEFLKAAKG